jgi:hypothetical protein
MIIWSFRLRLNRFLIEGELNLGKRGAVEDRTTGCDVLPYSRAHGLGGVFWQRQTLVMTIGADHAYSIWGCLVRPDRLVSSKLLHELIVGFTRIGIHTRERLDQGFTGFCAVRA